MYSSQVYLEESVVHSQKMLATPTPPPPQSDPVFSTPTKTVQVAMKITTPSTRVSVTPSKQSRCDYACYTLRKDGGILAVIIEAKMENSSQEAVAQLMGYVSAFAKNCYCPPLAIVVTQTGVECLLFPFITEGDGERLLKAAAFTLDLWKQDRCTLNQKVFRLLGSFINEDVRKKLQVSVETCKDWEKMRAIEQVVSHEQHELEALRRKNEELQEDAKMAQQREEAAQQREEALRRDAKLAQQREEALRRDAKMAQQREEAAQQREEALRRDATMAQQREEAAQQREEALQRVLEQLKRKLEQGEDTDTLPPHPKHPKHPKQN